MAWLGIYGPAVELKAAYERITRIGKSIQQSQSRSQQSQSKSKQQDGGLRGAQASEGGTPAPKREAVRDERTLDQVRADVLGDLLTEGIVPAHPKAARGIRAEVVVTVPALSLLDDAQAAQAEPARVEGVGPVSIGIARRLCGGSKDWMRVLTHPESGIILSVGRKKYRPPKALRQLVKWRAGCCLAPGCNVPAERCDIDHGIDWAKGGQTRLGNLAPLCRGHHVVKHGTAWYTDEQPDGSMRWVSPLGRVYTVLPERTLPTFTLPAAPF